MRFLTFLTATLFATQAAATTAIPVPELTAVGATAAIAGVATVVALVRERRNRRD